MKATTIEQSRKLIKLGLDQSTADIVYPYNPYLNDIPAWSLSALLDLMPQNIITEDCEEYILEISKEDDVTYFFGYRSKYDDTLYVEFISQEAVEAAYKLVCWLLENKCI